MALDVFDIAILAAIWLVAVNRVGEQLAGC
jgi:hypothetical protein